MSELYPEFECPICYCGVNDENTKILHINSESNVPHSVCQQCHQKLRDNYVRACPLCREPINGDLVRQHMKIIGDMQLLSFNISQEFIEHIKETRPGLLPYRYYNNEGVQLIRNLKEDYQNYQNNQNNQNNIGIGE